MSALPVSAPRDPELVKCAEKVTLEFCRRYSGTLSAETALNVLYDLLERDVIEIGPGACE